MSQDAKKPSEKTHQTYQSSFSIRSHDQNRMYKYVIWRKTTTSRHTPNRTKYAENENKNGGQMTTARQRTYIFCGPVLIKAK